MKEKAIQLLDALHPLVQMSVKWLQCNVDFAFVLAAFTETPRWTVAFKAIHEPTWIGVPLGVLLAFSTARAWRRYFEQPANYKLLWFNVGTVAIAVAVISPVLYALTFTKAEDIDLSKILQPWALGAWACLLAVSTFSPLVQLAAVTEVKPVAELQEENKTLLGQLQAIDELAAARDAIVEGLNARLQAQDEAPLQPDLPANVMTAWNMRQNGMTVAAIAASMQKSERTIAGYLKEAKETLQK